jgi:hypothetical protein
MAVHSSASIGSSVTQTKRKEIYKYEAQWTVYSMNWSVRPDKRFRLALGSFIEEYNNKVFIFFFKFYYFLLIIVFFYIFRNYVSSLI